MKYFYLLTLISFQVFSKSVQVITQEYNYQNVPELQAIMAQLKPYGSFSQKKIEENIPKQLSRGQQLIEEAKAKNRAIIAQNNAADKAKEEQKLDGIDAWKAEVKKTQEAWKKEILEQRKQWQKEQEIFLGRLKVYQENAFEIPVKKEVIVEKKVTVSDLPDVHIVNGAFEVPIRDQGGRPTCSAFAGIRALEILLAQNKINIDLSEQYFYWASKPNCQSSPCAEKGSWITNGLTYSQKRPELDIPQEDHCLYKNTGVPENETQIPLLPSCRPGGTKVEKFEEVRTLAEVIEKLKKDTPVIMAAKLSPNFYLNQGLITLADSSKNIGKMDYHSMGHAFISVGVIELPEKLKTTEGNYCLVIANSWGKGWGAGGYSCLTENWLLKYRQPSPFMTVTGIRFKD